MVLVVHVRRKEHRNRVGRCFFEGVSDEAVEFMVNLLFIYFSSLHQADSCDGGR